MPNKAGRPTLGLTTVKTGLGPTWFALLNHITDRMPTFTRAAQMRRQSGLTLTPSEDRTWDRSSVVANLTIAAAPQFAHQVLGEQHAVKKAHPCPLCFGYVDGPHSPTCGYFGPLAELDPNYDSRLREALRRADGRTQLQLVDRALTGALTAQLDRA
jgi:hypothetical protein